MSNAPKLVTPLRSAPFQTSLFNKGQEAGPWFISVYMHIVGLIAKNENSNKDVKVSSASDQWIGIPKVTKVSFSFKDFFLGSLRSNARWGSRRPIPGFNPRPDSFGWTKNGAVFLQCDETVSKYDVRNSDVVLIFLQGHSRHNFDRHWYVRLKLYFTSCGFLQTS